nr:MAG TPA: hypothetical protein [Caudoviricetes sp.]
MTISSCLAFSDLKSASAFNFLALSDIAVLPVCKVSFRAAIRFLKSTLDFSIGKS